MTFCGNWRFYLQDLISSPLSTKSSFQQFQYVNSWLLLLHTIAGVRGNLAPLIQLLLKFGGLHVENQINLYQGASSLLKKEQSYWKLFELSQNVGLI